MVRVIIAVIIIAAVLMLFGSGKKGSSTLGGVLGTQAYIGGISPAGKTSALPGGYRSEAPNSGPYNTSPTQ